MFDKPRTIKSQWDEYTLSEINELTIKDGENNTIITGLKVGQYIVEMYGNYKTRSDMLYLWAIYTTIHGADFLKAYNAWMTNYDPLENYNGSETNVYLTNDGIVTNSTTHGKTTTTTANSVTNENQVTTFESTTYRPDSKSVQSGSTTAADSGTTSETVTHTATTLSVGDTEYSADNVHGEIKNRHGNLGVTTSQQMITSEIEMRLKPLIMMYIDTFINEYAYYVTDSWGCWD